MREMPTAAKLVAALALAAVAFAAAWLFLPVLSPARQGPLFAPVNAALGAFIGWRLLGRATGKGYNRAAGAGIGSAFWLLFWSLLLFSSREMILRSLDKRYHSPVEAVGSVGVIAIEHAKLALQPGVLAVLFLGGLVGGLLAEAAGRAWN